MDTMEFAPSVFSLLPVVVAIGLALWTRQVVLSLFSGVLIAALLIASGNPWDALIYTVDPWLLDAISDRDHVKVVLFSLFVAATVELMNRSGGTRALVSLVTRSAKTRRSGMISTWLAGMVVFFDDYANCLIVGSAMRPVTDRLKISREKLAYLVDSTAAPMATIALVSTWVGYEVSLMGEAMATHCRSFSDLAMRDSCLVDINAYAFFIEGLPYRFYPLLALSFGFWIAWTGRDFGPMRTAENNAIDSEDPPDLSSKSQSSIWLAILPITALVSVTGISLWVQGSANSPVGARMFEIVGNADGYDAMLHASITSLSISLILTVGISPLNLQNSISAAIDGMKHLFDALIVLFLAWALGSAVGELQAADWLLGALGDGLPIWSLPTVTFSMASAIAFATGTSFGTMAVLMPLALPMALGMDAPHEVTLAVSAAVLSGAVWGDHCSPISDTTVLASTGSNCEHTAHVKTQLPYALIVGLIAIVLGTIPAGFGANPWVMLILGVVICGVSVRVLGRHPTPLTSADSREPAAT